MRKLFLVVFLSCFFIRTSGQKSLPVINANSEQVDIRVGNDYFSKGGWTLEPGKNPDIFSIGSKWPYRHKQVKFITDIDSISFDVQPGNKYDFIILKKNIPCHIQIVTLSNPVFLNRKTLISLVTGFFILILFLYYYRNKLSTKLLLQCGYLVATLFWVMSFASAFIRGNYNHFKNTISELGAIGTKSEFFTSGSLLFLSVLNLFFCIGFYKASKLRRLSVFPSILSFTMPVTMIWASVFTLGNEFHSMTGPLPVLIIIGSCLSYFLWKDKNVLQGLRRVSLISFAIMLLIMVRFIKPFGYEFEGLIQRFFYLGWSTWTIGISYFLSKDKLCKGNSGRA